ncbi:MAG: hypothetical protein ABJB74_11550 [Gemmatimonas sp.]
MNSLRKFVALEVAALCALGLCSEGAGAQRLFRSTDPVDVTFTTDLRALVKDRDSTKFKPHGTLMTYTDPANGKLVSVPVTLQTRGHFRRQARNCEFPPFSMVFRKKDADNTILQGNTKLKVAVNCKPGSRLYEQYVLQEYAAYRLYQRISPFHFRTRLAKAVFKDSLAKTGDVTTWAFFIEDEAEIAKEFKTSSEKTKGAMFDQLEPTQLAITMLYEYMVGNTDYSISQQHNIALLRDSTATVIRTVAYDFDWSGVVNPRYATPDPRLGIKLVTERIYRGPCLTVAQWQPTLDWFVAARPAIDSIYKSIPSLEPRVVKSSLEYYNDFYKAFADPKAIKRNLIDPCQRAGN